jgi:hypothetical protein
VLLKHPYRLIEQDVLSQREHDERLFNDPIRLPHHEVPTHLKIQTHLKIPTYPKVPTHHPTILTLIILTEEAQEALEVLLLLVMMIQTMIQIRTLSKAI